MGIHGGTDETSMMLHLRPELVDLSAGVRNVPEHLADNRYVRFGGAVSFGWLSNDFGAERPHRRSEGGDRRRGASSSSKVRSRAFGEALAEVARFDFGRS